MVAAFGLGKNFQVQAGYDFLFVDRLIIYAIIHNFSDFFAHEFRLYRNWLKAFGGP